jgi:hypothetical protein
MCGVEAETYLPSPGDATSHRNNTVPAEDVYVISYPWYDTGSVSQCVETGAHRLVPERPSRALKWPLVEKINSEKSSRVHEPSEAVPEGPILPRYPIAPLERPGCTMEDTKSPAEED